MRLPCHLRTTHVLTGLRRRPLPEPHRRHQHHRGPPWRQDAARARGTHLLSPRRQQPLRSVLEPAQRRRPPRRLPAPGRHHARARHHGTPRAVGPAVASARRGGGRSHAGRLLRVRYRRHHAPPDRRHQAPQPHVARHVEPPARSGGHRLRPGAARRELRHHGTHRAEPVPAGHRLLHAQRDGDGGAHVHARARHACGAGRPHRQLAGHGDGSARRLLRLLRRVPRAARAPRVPPPRQLRQGDVARLRRRCVRRRHHRRRRAAGVRHELSRRPRVRVGRRRRRVGRPDQRRGHALHGDTVRRHRRARRGHACLARARQRRALQHDRGRAPARHRHAHLRRRVHGRARRRVPAALLAPHRHAARLLGLRRVDRLRDGEPAHADVGRVAGGREQLRAALHDTRARRPAHAGAAAHACTPSGVRRTHVEPPRFGAERYHPCASRRLCFRCGGRRRRHRHALPVRGRCVRAHRRYDGCVCRHRTPSRGDWWVRYSEFGSECACCERRAVQP
eukprot:PhM_4_TR8455/c0_g1_i1/m.1864